MFEEEKRRNTSELCSKIQLLIWGGDKDFEEKTGAQSLNIYIYILKPMHARSQVHITG